MEVRPDKNGNPFGYCPLCSQQLAVRPRNDRLFRENWGLPLSNDPVTVTVTDQVPDTVPITVPVLDQIPVPEPVADPVTEQKPKKKISCLLDE